MPGAMRAAAVAVALMAGAVPARAQHTHDTSSNDSTTHQRMWMVRSDGGWAMLGMGQVFPTYSWSLPAAQNTPLRRSGLYATQPAIMVDIMSPNNAVVLRTTLNFEALTQRGGELTYGAWGEGFIDKRHPHTLLHETMLSGNVFRSDGINASVSVGKGFAPYGTDDPMSRPVLKYPTNHHLSQIVERWTINGAVATPAWSIEAGLFSGNEPAGPYDLSNTDGFGRSWSARLTRRFGPVTAGTAAWEVSASMARVREEHHDGASSTLLFNGAVRHERERTFGRVYGLAEFSRSRPDHGDGYYAALLEGSVLRNGRQPYLRLEIATRPEFARGGDADTRGFFRYDHAAGAVGATRWTIITAGFGWTATALPFSVRPYAEMQYNAVSRERGTIRPEELYGRSAFWAFSVGARIFAGGDPMRMGAYGVLDPMTLMHHGSVHETSSLETHRH